MSRPKSSRRSAAQGAASRINSRKSIGPNTAAGKKNSSQNARKHGRRARTAARPLWQPVAQLGEDPARYRLLLGEAVSSFSTQTPLELRLCEDITRLRLQLERNQQAQEAKLVHTYQELESSRE
jgi:hypothetical protein